MKKRILSLILTFCMLISLMPAVTLMAGAVGGSWSPVGTAGLSAGMATYTSLAIYNGTPYVAYTDNANSSKATVMRYVDSAWKTVGTADFSASTATYISLAFDSSGMPYVAYQDLENYSLKATVMKYTGSGTTGWEPVGSAGFSKDRAYYTSLAFDGGTPYVAYMDNGNDKKATVMKFNGTSWEPVGSAGFSAGEVTYTSLAFYGEMPYVAYGDAKNNNKATVMKYTGSGTTGWEPVGSAGFSASGVTYTSLAFDGATPYVAYEDSGNGNKATVMKYTGKGTTGWETVGSPAFSAGIAYYTSLAICDGTPYVAYQDCITSTNRKMTVMKYTGSGTTGWEPVGTAGFSAGTAAYISLAINGGTPYVAYQDAGNDYKATMMKYDSFSAPTVTTTSVGTYTATTATLGGNVTSDGGAPVTDRGVLYSSTDSTPEIGESGVTQDSSGTGTGTFSETISGLSSGTTYHVRAYAINSIGTSYGSVQDFTTAGGTVYPYYVITKGVDATEALVGNYHVYKKADSAGSFAAFTASADADTNTAYSTIAKAMTAVTVEVASGSATLQFGATGTDEKATGTLEIANESIVLGSGTYTLKGSLKEIADADGDTDNTLELKGASIIIGGAYLENSSNQCVILQNYDSTTKILYGGSITMTSGDVTNSGTGACIDYAGSGNITVSGGKIYSKANYAVKNAFESTGTVSISGSEWSEADKTGTLLQSGGTAMGSSCALNSSSHVSQVTISGGTFKSALFTVMCSGPLTVSGGTIQAQNGPAMLLSGSTACHISGGTVTSANTTVATADALINTKFPGTVFASDYNSKDAKLYISGGTITNTAAGCPAIYNISLKDYDSSSFSLTSDLYLSGTPSISGSADIWTNRGIHASDGTTPYTGGALKVEYGGTITSGTTALVSDVTSGTNDQLFSITNADYGLALNADKLIIKASAYYVITKGATETSYFYVCKKADSTGSFDAFTALADAESNTCYSTISAAISAITTEVGSGSATLQFAKTGTDEKATDTLDIGSENIVLGESGTYTIKGSLTGGSSSVIRLSGASISVNGANIKSTGLGGIAIKNTDAGSVAVAGGSLEVGLGKAIQNTGSGNITISGGTLKSTGIGSEVILNGGSGNITVSGGELNGTYTGILNSGTGSITVSGGTVYSEKSSAIVNEGTGMITISGTADISSAYVYDAVYLSNGTSGGTILEMTGGTVRNTCTLPLGTDDCMGPDFAIGIGNDGVGTVDISGGSITGGTNGSGIFNYSTGVFNISGGTINGGAYGGYNQSTGLVCLSGTDTAINGGTASIASATSGTVIANDGESTPTYYGGGNISVYFAGTIESGTTVAVGGVSDSNCSEFSLTNKGYTLTKSDGNLLITKQTASNGGGGYDTPSRTITVTDTNSDLFSGSKGQIKAEANMTNAFSDSVEVKVTDTKEKASNFGLGAGNEVFPFDISLYIKGTNTKTEPKDGYAVTISLPVPDNLLNEKEQLSILHKSDDGTVTTLKSQLKQISGVWYLVFDASEFSPYALVLRSIGTYDESAGLPYYVDSNGNSVFIGFAANGKYIAPSGVTVLFKKNAKSFTDTESHWAKDYIGFVSERELFSGTGNNKFEPETGMTRAMLATVIGRLYERSYGEIKAQSTHSFNDCDYSAYYGKYVDWAAKEGIITGYGNGEFGPNDQITREQMAAMLYRFADFLGILPSNMNTSLTYTDAGTISSWARNAALYCQSTGIITGRDGGSFAPNKTATRAEVAAIIQRFIKAALN